MKVLSLDQSLNSTGFCIWEDGLLYDFGVINPPKDSAQHIKLLYIVETLEKLIKDEDITELVLEGMSFSSSGQSVRILGAVYFNILILTYKYNLLWDEVTPTSLKKFATGNGRADKKDMWNALPENIQQKFNVKYKTISSGKFDICDSYYLGKYYYEKIKGY